MLKLYRDLEAIKQEKQVTGNTHQLSKAMRMMPPKYRAEFVKIHSEQGGDPGMDIWKLLTEFQETNKMVIKAHTPWELDKPMLIRPRNQVKAISRSVENA